MAFSHKILEKSIDPTVHQMLDRAEQLGIETVWDRYEKMLPECGFGELGVCCRNCNMGPCRIKFGGKKDRSRGVCGATADTIAARGLLRAIAAGTSAHAQHGRDLAETFLMAAKGDTEGYGIRDEQKLFALAADLGVTTDGRSVKEVAIDVGRAALLEFSTSIVTRSIS